MVSEIQRERVLPEVVFLSFCDLIYSVPNPVKPSAVDESVIRCHGRLGHLGESEWRTEADHRVHRERNHDGTVFSSSDVDVRREDRKRLEEDTVAKRKDSIYLFNKHRDAAVTSTAWYVPAIRHLLQHSQRSARRIDVLCGDEGKKASVKLDEIVIYWEQKLPTLLETLHTSPW